MATIYIDDRPYEVQDGQNLLQACLGLGFNLPYFCWHPALGSVGACRQCAVKRFRDEKDQRGELVMACMTPADNGTRIRIDDPEAVQFRASVIEWLMINHPHDCPVCDEGGECHLQDMTVMTGHNQRRYRFAKRTHRNQDLGPFINHEMNRCIQCYRCVRFYHDYAGGRDLNVFASHNHVYFGRCRDGALESEFSGNLVEICPTGVFTDKSFKAHFTRKWDLQTAPSVCVHCGLGCNTLPGERYGGLRRVRNRYHHQLNGYFLCDRGRYGYEFVNSDRRLRQPAVRDAKQPPAIITGQQALVQAAAALSDPAKVIAIGSPRASLEANFALRRLAGADRFYAGLSEAEHDCLDTASRILQNGGVPAIPLQGAGMCDAVLVLGEDVTQTAPILALNLRRLRYRKAALAASGFQLPEWNDAGVREFIHMQKAALFTATPYPTRLDDEASRALCAPPHELARLGWAIRDRLAPQDQKAPELAGPLLDFADAVAEVLRGAARPLIVTGSGCGTPALLEAAADIAATLQRQGRSAGLIFCLPECNTMGLGLLRGRRLASAFAAVAQDDADTVIILENDLYRRAEAAAVDAMLAKARRVIVLDHTATATSARAHIVLPTATFAEASGTLVNNEGRAQRAYAVMPPEGEVQPAWHWLQQLVGAGGKGEMPAWRSEKDLVADLAREIPLFSPVAELDPVVPVPSLDGKIPRQSHRYTGRTAMRAHIAVSEPKPPADTDTPLAYSMEGYDGPPPAGLITRFWAPGWNSVQSLNKFQSEIGGTLKGGDPGRRLLEPAGSDTGPGLTAPQAATPGDDDYLLIPVHHIFGSEELSMVSPGIARRAPGPYLALAPDNGLAREGQTVRATVAGTWLDLPVRLLPGLPPRSAGLPVGLPGMSFVRLPAVARIELIKGD